KRRSELCQVVTALAAFNLAARDLLQARGPSQIIRDRNFGGHQPRIDLGGIGSSQLFARNLRLADVDEKPSCAPKHESVVRRALKGGPDCSPGFLVVTDHRVRQRQIDPANRVMRIPAQAGTALANVTPCALLICYINAL